MKKLKYSSSFVSSHRLKSEEKKVVRKAIRAGIFFAGFIIFAVYIGVPGFVRIIAGMSSTKKATTETREETVYLLPPVLDTLPEATNSAKITVSGFGEKETTVYLFVNNEQKAKTIVDKDGKFALKNIRLAEGENTLSARLEFENYQSSMSADTYINYQKNPPKLEITEPEDNKKFYSDERDIEIKGETDTGTEVTINDRLVIVDPNGNFSYPVSLNNGENIFKIVAVDKAGNQTVLERKATYSP